MDLGKKGRQYLTRYGEPSLPKLGDGDGPWNKVVVIPSCGEGQGIFRTLHDLENASRGRSVLCILVVNAPAGADDATHALNEETLLWLEERCGCKWVGRESHYLDSGREMALLIVDRASKGLRFKEPGGVGLARKVGADLAIQLCLDGFIEGDWIWNTDADVGIPLDYFAQLSAFESSAVAGIYPFNHHSVSGGIQQEATELYDLWLRYYASGLRWAGSPYGFPTVGSTFAMRMDAYVTVRGFPKREAGEDFYLLNKLAKIGGIQMLMGPRLELSGRLSTRVPFGTGQGILRNMNQLESNIPIEFHHPDVFAHLKKVLIVLKKSTEATSLEAAFQSLQGGVEEPLIMDILRTLGVESALTAAITGSKNPEARIRRIMEWFDGLKTLRFVHKVRDSITADCTWKDAIECALFMDGDQSHNNPRILGVAP